MSVHAAPSDDVPWKLHLFAGAVLHELRTPLAALSGEVDLILRRERSLPEYRDALERIADRVGEIVEITGDLAFLAEPGFNVPLQRASLSGVLLLLSERYAPPRATDVSIDTLPASLEITGDEQLLIRALTLLVEHGLRHRRDGAALRLGMAPDTGDGSPEWIQLRLEANHPGFAPNAWHGLGSPDGDGLLHAPGLLRLHAVAAMLRACHGAVDLDPSADALAVRVTFRRALTEEPR